MNEIKSLKSNWTQNITFKLSVIFFLILFIQIPISYVRELIYERQQMKNVAQREIAQRWGGENAIGTPLIKLSIPQKTVNTNQRIIKAEAMKVQLLEAMNTSVDITLDVSKRYLGIYEAAIYKAHITMQGNIMIPPDILSEDMKSAVFIPLDSLRNIKNIKGFKINQKSMEYKPISSSFNGLKGFEIPLPADVLKESVNFYISLELAGSENLNVLPLADSTDIQMASNWNSPSFTGNRLPDEREISTTGFQAKWQVHNVIKGVNPDSPSADVSAQSGISGQNKIIGVRTIIPANIYQVNERSVKYSFLVVLLSFAGFFLAELFFKLRLHPFQYLLIGASLSVFYLLLLSVSEYLTFNVAFLISSVAIISLISTYCSVVLKQKIRGIYSGMIFAVLYLFIFILIKQEQSSLLMGSIAIWLVLALIMFITRKIDWYAVSFDSRNSDKQDSADG